MRSGSLDPDRPIASAPLIGAARPRLTEPFESCSAHAQLLQSRRYRM